MSEKHYETIIYRTKNSSAWVILNRPERKNAINVQFTIDLRQSLLECASNESVRAVVITGEGNIFCAGADLNPNEKLAVKTINSNNKFYEANLYFHSAISIITSMKKPVIAALNGGAAGAGMSLALACDIAVAKESAKLNWAYTQRGLVPDGGSTQTLTRRIGIHRAMELAFTGRVLSAKEAKEWGILNEIYPDNRFNDELQSLVKRIASGPTWSYGTTKHLIRQSFFNNLETQMELENQAIAEAATKEDFIEGTLSFLEKRQPIFKGK